MAKNREREKETAATTERDGEEAAPKTEVEPAAAEAAVLIVYDGSRGSAIGMAKAIGEPTRYFAAGVPQLVDDRELVAHLLSSKKGFSIADAIDNAKG